jgi:hypothetical protein
MHSLKALGFLKENFGKLKVTNVHTQSNAILFDIPNGEL